MPAAKLCTSVTKLLCLALFLATAFARGATIRVPADQPTIQAGINAASNGDTVLVAPGTYYENIVIDTKEITLTSEQGASKTILDGGTNDTVLTIRNTPSIATTINGFTVQGGKNTNQFIAGGIHILRGGASIANMTFGANYGGQIYVESGSALISSNTITSSPFQTPQCINGWDVIKMYGLSTVVDPGGKAVPTRILNNLIEGDGICTGLAIRGNGGDLEVTNNIIRNNIYGISTYPTGLIVRQNLIYGNRDGALFIAHPISGSNNPSSYTDPPDFFIVNNTIVNNARNTGVSGVNGSIFLDSSRAKVAFINNLLIGGSSFPVIHCQPSSDYTPVIFDHNDLYNNAGPLVDSACPTISGINGNISLPAGFANSSDLHLAPGSPAIDAGNNSAPNLPSTDLDGNPRIQDSAGNGFTTVDMGAYEATGTQNTTPSALTLTSSGYYVNPGTVTLTAAFSPANSPVRPVSFYQDGNFLFSAPLSPATPVSTDVTLNKPGVYSFTAKLDAAAGFSPATSVVIYVYVASPNGQLAPTSTTLAASANPVPVGQGLRLISMVTSSASGTPPTGTVTFYDGNTPLGTMPLDTTGHAVYPTSALSAGVHTLHSVYNGDTLYAQSTSPNISVTVQLVPSTTTLTITPNPSVAGQPLAATVQVAPIASSPYSSQLCLCTVTVTIAGVPANVASTYTQPLQNGSATFNFGLGFGAGTYTLSAAFNGSATFASSNSAPVQQVVAIAPTTIGLTASPNPVVQRQTVNFTAVITAPLSAVIPPGVITFFDGATSIGSAPYGSAGPIPVNQISNTATVTIGTDTLSAGTHTITASYPGTSSFLPSVSAPVTVTVTPMDFAIAVSNTAMTIQTEHHLTTNVTLTSIGAFADKLTLGCANLPPHASCTFDTNSVQLLPNGTATAKLTVDTDDVLGFRAALSQPQRPGPRTSGPIAFALLLPVGFLGLAALSRRRQTLPRLLLLIVATFAATLSITGCDGLYPASTAPGVYTIQVTASGAASGLSHSAPITVTVTK
ncbi:MAG: Ig-like domain repeat protein [Acidobacteria bacterium]|nr:Ig-like domain repeat protein [Acidobacteriota bacterium]